MRRAASLAAAATIGALGTRPNGSPVAGPAAVDSSGLGWTLDSLHLDVRVAAPPAADSGARLVVEGTALLRAPTTPSTLSSGPALVVAPGGVAFDALDVDGGTSTFSRACDTARVRLARPAPPGTLLAARFRLLLRRDRVGRSVAVGAAGAFASYGGNWYPWPAAAPNADPDLVASGTLRATVPAAWHTLSNGRRVDSAVAGGVRVERWASDRPVAWSFVSAPFVVTRRRVGATDVAAYVMPRQAQKVRALAAAIPPMVETLARAYGPYPFGTFAVAALPAAIAPPGMVGRSEQGYFLAHEHALDGDTVAVALFAHELAHMWWANLVDSRPPGDDMMDEGLASQGAAIVVAAREGRAAARRWLHDGEPAWSARGFFHLWRVGADRPLMTDYDPLTPRAKGPLVYEMLRDRLGDSLYFATLRAFVREHAGHSASLADLRAAFVTAAPNDSGLARFLADWLDRPGAPVLDVSWSPAGARRVRVRIAQRTAPYVLPLDVAIEGGRASRVTTVRLTDSVQTFVVAAPARATAVRLDPEHKLLLWEPALGPVPGVTPPWNEARSRAWLADEIAWLARRFGVRTPAVAVVHGGRVVWAVGRATPPTLGTLLDSLTARRDAHPVSLVAYGAGRTDYALGRPDAGTGVVVHVDDERIGVTLATEIAQRVAVVWRWPSIPGR